MKKYSKYIVILFIGLFLGRFIYKDIASSKTNQTPKNEELKTQKWTCSMHPQIMQSEPGDCPICGMELIPAETTNTGDNVSINQFKLTKNAMALANIETTIVKKGGNTSNGLVLSGKIQENEKATAVQTSYFNGRIEKLYINSEGDKVSKGQLLALIYSPELVTAQEELLTALSMKTTQPNLYNAVKNKLRIWKLSENQINKIETTKKVLMNFPVYANVSGIVTAKLVEEGTSVKEGTPLLKISNLTTVWAEFDAYEKQLSSIKKGDEISITTNADPSKEIKATISFIDPVLNTSTRTTTVRAELNNKNEALKPGMFVQGTLNSAKKTAENSLLTIPKSAVLWTGKRSVVYIKEKSEEPVFEMREITLGNVIGNMYEVLQGLNENDEIVTNGTFTVDAAAQLQGKKSMMNKMGEMQMTDNENHSEKEKAMNMSSETLKIEVSPKFKQQLQVVFTNYIQLKDALVNDNPKKAQETAKVLLNSLNKVDMKLLTEEKSHKTWMDIKTELVKSTNKILSESTIKSQRNEFIHLSNNFIKVVKIFGVNQKVYKQFCPMAANNKGAFWLSTEEKIMNPYFGASMLHCGSVEETIE
ncbi:efflux RND transporter periplasmic adaptor subunit [Lutibacter sp. B1]|uniref:efflux RND transporter periplasmic adaptor subunit n=1 Tax=Lutibacter sp. B1 TaxID=2725996 RepID=UPI00145709F0|nr:efflux RND transporter periplasmic adaptor subunit [Lutibacter sp. B1]NLP58554.1 efflux RND transporter periplasmic adaptor subunit [Lutibacter sp. B1]